DGFHVDQDGLVPHGLLEVGAVVVATVDVGTAVAVEGEAERVGLHRVVAGRDGHQIAASAGHLRSGGRAGLAAAGAGHGHARGCVRRGRRAGVGAAGTATAATSRAAPVTAAFTARRGVGGAPRASPRVAP